MRPTCIIRILGLASIITELSNALVPTSPPPAIKFPSLKTNNVQDGSRDGIVVVVGKIIIDEYRSPKSSSPSTDPSEKITVGGGGPQAAWGAAAALAVMQTLQEPETMNHVRRTSTLPPKQPVAFFGPVGGSGKQEQEELQTILGSAIESIHLIREPSLQTPTIQLWHDEKQDIQWKPLNDSWGAKGADSLWRNRPSAQDVLMALQKQNQTAVANLHLIMEVGTNAAGGGQDSLLLSNAALMDKVAFVGIEPVAFPEESKDGTVAISQSDVASCEERLGNYISKMDLIVPDSHLVEALEASGFWKASSPPLEIAGRFGPQGSKVYSSFGTSNNSDASEYITISVAKLTTADGKPVNPTGAGNAYSAALSTCRSKGLSLCESACIATAIGAVVCEYEHLPLWNWDVIDRIRKGALEVYETIEATVVVPGD
jgi:hypothetical protein